MEVICCICTDCFLEDHSAPVCSIPCGHIYHRDCLNSWYKRNQTCPQCTKEFSPADIHKLYLSVDLPKTNDEGSHGSTQDVGTLNNLDRMLRKLSVLENLCKSNKNLVSETARQRNQTCLQCTKEFSQADIHEWYSSANLPKTNDKGNHVPTQDEGITISCNTQDAGTLNDLDQMLGKISLLEDLCKSSKNLVSETVRQGGQLKETAIDEELKATFLSLKKDVKEQDKFQKKLWDDVHDAKEQTSGYIKLLTDRDYVIRCCQSQLYLAERSKACFKIILAVLVAAFVALIYALYVKETGFLNDYLVQSLELKLKELQREYQRCKIERESCSIDLKGLYGIFQYCLYSILFGVLWKYNFFNIRGWINNEQRRY